MERTSRGFGGVRESVTARREPAFEIDLFGVGRDGTDGAWAVGRVFRFRQTADVSCVRRRIRVETGRTEREIRLEEPVLESASLAVVVLPVGATLHSADPAPTFARARHGRLELYWAPGGSAITLELGEAPGTLEADARRWNRRGKGRGALFGIDGIRVVPPPRPAMRGPFVVGVATGVVVILAIAMSWIARTPTSPVEMYGASHAVVIGIDHYPSDEWPDLRYAVRDARGVAALLRDQGFHVHTLYDDRATKQAILELVQDELAPRLRRDDRLTFYFAGHGYSQSIGEEEWGYIVPFDSNGMTSSYISMEKLRELSAKMSSAKHQLFLLDACFGGMIMAGRAQSDVPASRDIRGALAGKARQVLTAGGPGERVNDEESPNAGFTGSLLRGVGRALADQDDDGFVTASELAAYVARHAANERGTPRYATLPGHEDGDFVFEAPAPRVAFNVNPESAAFLLAHDDPPPPSASRLAEVGTRGTSIYRRVAPSVVFVLPGDETVGGHGSGFLVDERTVVTNHHVVADQWAIDPDRPGLFVRLQFGMLVDGQMQPCDAASVRAYIVGVDDLQDLALLEFDPDDVRCAATGPLELSAQSALPGTSCEMFGHPLGSFPWSVRRGNVMGSGKSPDDLVDELIERLGLRVSEADRFRRESHGGPVQDILMTNNVSNFGDSGGPVVDSDGAVIGVNCGVSVGGFTYHVDARHVGELLDRRGSLPLPFVPDSHRFLTPKAQLFWGYRVLASQPSEGEPDRYLLDLDGDTDQELLLQPRMHQLLTERKFDAEVAIHRVGHRVLVFYQSEETREMNTILVYERDRSDPARGLRATHRFSRGSDGEWTIDPASGTPWMDESLLREDLRDTFVQFAQALNFDANRAGTQAAARPDP